MYAEDNDGPNAHDPVDWIHHQISHIPHASRDVAEWHNEVVLGDRIRDKTR